MAYAPMRWRARSSSPAQPCNGCATVSASCKARRKPAHWRRRPIRRKRLYLVPAFVGLGAPYWRPEARGALFGLTRATGPRRIGASRAGERVFPDRGPFDRHECRLAGRRRRTQDLTRRRRHGGVRLDHAAARRSDGSRVDRPRIKETTALGAAYLAGLHAGFFPEPDRFASSGSPSDGLRRRWTRPCANEN